MLVTFVNSRLAETWKERGETVETHMLEGRREVYNAELPDGVCVLTMGVDTQDNRLAYEIVGWGFGYESWGIEYGEIFGDPRRGEVWNRLDDLLSRAWSYGNGKRIIISRAAVDTGGHMGTQVYNYCRARQGRGVYPIKGQGGDKLPLARPSAAKASREKGLFIVGVDGIKSETVSWLQIKTPGNGYCHFPKDNDGISVNGYDANYFAMLTAEKKVLRKDKRGFTKFEWVKLEGARNESFDCRVYARAALRIMSPRDDIMLRRKHSSEPWAAQSVKNTSVKNTAGKKITAPQAAGKKKPGRNQIARGKGISL